LRFNPLVIPIYKISRVLGCPLLLPINITISVTFRCNSKCKTCNVYKREGKELTLEEFKKIFSSIGKGRVWWVTFSGGEVFLREDFKEIVISFYKICKPKIINIPTNGLLTSSIIPCIQEILKVCEDTKIIVNISIDSINEHDDYIRGIPGAFKKAIDTFIQLKKLEQSFNNLNVGIHTVISVFNVNNFPYIYDHLKKYRPSSYITEIAEEREELKTIGWKITPSYLQYVKAINYLINDIKKQKSKGMRRIIDSFRIEYYQITKKVLKTKKQIIPCFAGFASCHITPQGDVWECCIKCSDMGNLKDYDYNFRKLWKDKKAQKIREEIKKTKCFCTLANASYTNILINIRYLIKVLSHFIK